MKGGAAWDLYQQVELPSPSQARDALHDVDIGITAPSVEYLVGILTCFNLHHTVAIRPSNGHSPPTLIKTQHPDATTYKVCLLYEGPHIIGYSLTLPPTQPDGLSLDVSLMWPGKSGVDYVHTDLAVQITQQTTRFMTLHGYTMADVIEARQTKRMIETDQHVVGLHWRFCKWASRGYHYNEDTWAHAQESFEHAYLDPRSTMTTHMPRRFDGMSPQEQERECSVMLTMCLRLNLAVPRWVGERFPSIRPWPRGEAARSTCWCRPRTCSPVST
ncbi:hypothetical protein EBZ35_03180, partial [bacterium]|nr:hypothetical protein [bacterium]